LAGAGHRSKPQGTTEEKYWLGFGWARQAEQLPLEVPAQPARYEPTVQLSVSQGRQAGASAGLHPVLYSPFRQVVSHGVQAVEAL